MSKRLSGRKIATLKEVARAFDHTHGELHRFHGRRIFAVDGSKISVQRSEELWQEFGGPPLGYSPQILLSVLYDVNSKIPRHRQWAP